MLPKKFNQINKKVTNTPKDQSFFQTNSREGILSDGQDKFDNTVALTGYFSSGDLQELDQKCYSMMEKTSNKHTNGLVLYRCKVCGKEDINQNIKQHIEAHHLEGISIPCNYCEKTFRSRKAMFCHKKSYHKSL